MLLGHEPSCLQPKLIFTPPPLSGSILVVMGLSKSFKLTETMKLDFRAQAQNLTNHPNFDCIDANLNSSTFGKAQCLTPFGLGAPKSRVMSLGLRLAF